MKRFLFIVLIVAGACADSRSQNMILHDPVSSRIFSVDKYSGIKGTPFLREDWIQGSVNTSKGFYNNLELKLDLYGNTLFFKRDDKEYEFEDKVNGFILMQDPNDSSTYQYFVKGLTGSGIRSEQFVQILEEGRLNLYRADNKQLTELNQVNQGIIKSFSTSTRYLLLKENSLQTIRLNKNDLLEKLGDRRQEIEDFIKTKKPDPKKESGLVSIIRYYNSL